jgi:hypothetical protein
MSIRSNKKAKGIDTTPSMVPTLMEKPSGLLVARKRRSLQSPYIRAEDSSFMTSIPDELATLASCLEDNLYYGLSTRALKSRILREISPKGNSRDD